MKNDRQRFATLSEANDMNFTINRDGMFPLLIISALGKYVQDFHINRVDML